MESVDFDHWQRWRREGCTRLPAVLVCRDETPPPTWATFTVAPATALLESTQGGRYTYICDRPARLIVGQAASAEVRTATGAELLETRAGAPLDVLSTLLAERKTPALPRWPAMTGGLIALFGYDLVHTWERLPSIATRDLPLPLYAAIETRELFIFDHLTRTLGIVVWLDFENTADEAALAEKFFSATASLRLAHARWREPLRPVSRAALAPARDLSPPPPSFTPAAFQHAVRRVKDYIAAGDTYQVNLSLRTSRPTSLSAAAIYESLRRVNPSPYMGLFRTPDFALVCGSPELLVRLADGVVSSRPIAGTRRRGDASSSEDAALSAELCANEKERAEHLMLVDLIRNDIGRVAAFGSVHVPEFMAVERYSHVMHLVSQVEGRLAPGRTWPDVFRAMFPGGTITGCPKIRTMEIIDELEPVGRGFYTGALGWIAYGGEMEMNIVIRSMLVQRGLAHVQAGAGIVADSQPDRELDESLRKAQALWVALDQVETSVRPTS